MNEHTARHVVDGLREVGIAAHLVEATVYQFGVRVELGDGREAIWGAEGIAGLAAQVLMDGDLVGFVPELPGSVDFDDAQVVDAISRCDYSTPVATERPAPLPPGPALPIEGGVFRRFIDGFRYRE
ncbi:MAG: hypothetical protein M3O28_00285 [Actinomycetota bacterium]|nr:hypothetical protein [Actinomycetota bacterium]